MTILKMEFFSNMDEYDYKIIITFKYSHIKRKNNLSDFARKLIKIIQTFVGVKYIFHVGYSSNATLSITVHKHLFYSFDQQNNTTGLQQSITYLILPVIHQNCQQKHCFISMLLSGHWISKNLYQQKVFRMNHLTVKLDGLGLELSVMTQSFFSLSLPII